MRDRTVDSTSLRCGFSGSAKAVITEYRGIETENCHTNGAGCPSLSSRLEQQSSGCPALAIFAGCPSLSSRLEQQSRVPRSCDFCKGGYDAADAMSV
jgi:hypothetical protein